MHNSKLLKSTVLHNILSAVEIRFNGCAAKCCSTVDFDWLLVHTPTAHVDLHAVILRKVLKLTNDQPLF